MSKCRYCETELIYITTEKNRQMPCEAVKIQVWPTKKGKLTVCTDGGRTHRGSGEPVPFVGSVWGYPAHWGDCIGASRARRRK